MPIVHCAACGKACTVNTSQAKKFKYCSRICKYAKYSTPEAKAAKLSNRRARQARNDKKRKEKHYQWQKDYNRENHEKRRAVVLKSRIKNAEKIKEKRKAHWEKNIEIERARLRESYAKHRDKRIAYGVVYRAEHPRQVKEYSRAYSKAHPEYVRDNNLRRRARRKAVLNDLTVAQWEEIQQAYSHRCAYCGNKPKRLTQDHIIPLSKGGQHTVSNIVPACASCNSKKKAGPPLIPVQPMLLTIAPKKKKKSSG